MANLSEDIQCVGSDTRPPMLDRTDFASWQQRIRLYCQGKENGVNILKSIDEGPFQMGTFRETLAEGNEGCSKHMTGDRSRLRNFVQKFIGTVRFGNDQFGAIIGYGDYVISDSVISRAEAVATACYTQNRSCIYTLHNKTSYELVHDKKPDLTFFRVFGALCYPTNDSEDLGKLQPTADIGIFVGYAPSRKGNRIYNKRTRRIMETIHVQFDELTE
ncbi:retrovirus-related pol polyprotein from transposon TNT 1-94 [Tanacetum coccineum]